MGVPDLSFFLKGFMKLIYAILTTLFISVMSFYYGNKLGRKQGALIIKCQKAFTGAIE